MWSQVENVDLAARASERSGGEKTVHGSSPRSVIPVKKKETQRGSAFDGSVTSIARSGDILYAATSEGLLKSGTAGESWQRLAGIEGQDTQSVAVSGNIVLVSGLRTLELSIDGGRNWSGLRLPPQLQQIGAAAVDSFGAVWIGGREGVFISTDKGVTWETLKDLFLRDVNSIYYDEASQRMLLTANGAGSFALVVHLLRHRSVRVWETGWNLRFVRPVGDHLIGATLFDGIVVQPRMVDSADLSKR